MESIISPWFIYLLSLVDFFKEFFGFFAVVSGMAITTYLIGKVVIATRDGDDSNEMKNWGNVWKKAKVNLVLTSTGTVSSLAWWFIGVKWDGVG